MIANYGYDDGSGNYYITIDTDGCAECEDKGCIKACPAGIFEIELNDWDDEVAVINEDARNQLKQICSECKPITDRPEMLPCEKACKLQAIAHSW